MSSVGVPPVVPATPLRRISVLTWSLAVLAVSKTAWSQEPQTTIRGTVADSLTHQPLGGVAILIPGTEYRATTDPQGSFAIALAHGTTLLIQFHRRGYRSMEVEIDFPAEHVAEVALGTIPLPADATQLDSLIVEAVAPPPAGLAEFYERLNRGAGRFITREAIEQQRPSHVSEMFRGISAVRLRCSGAGNCVAATPRQPRQSIALEMRTPRDTLINRVQTAQDTLGTFCPMPVYLDGLPVADFNIDAVPPHDVMGIEIYTGALVPAKYRSSACGVILIWTSRAG